MILFRSAERIYGVKPNAIGDMRYITVPYSIAWLGFKTENKLDLYKIWKHQSLSEDLKKFLRQIMENVEKFIREKAPGSLYGEWAKKEECWNTLKTKDFHIDISTISKDLQKDEGNLSRRRVNEEDQSKKEYLEAINRIRSVTSKGWKIIEKWGRETDRLTVQQRDIAFNLASRLGSGSKILDSEKNSGLKILDFVLTVEPELLWEIEEEIEATTGWKEDAPEISEDLIRQMIAFDRQHKRLEDYKFRFMKEALNKPQPWDDRTIKFMASNYYKLKKYGFRIKEN